MSLGAEDESAEPSGSEAPRCSAKACRAAATVELRWRNPGLHDASRVKVWIACDDHADHLADFLARRSFLLARGPLGAEPPTGAPTPG